MYPKNIQGVKKMETVLYNNKNTVKILKMIFMNYISIIK